jgi:hypothetical protein
MFFLALLGYAARRSNLKLVALRQAGAWLYRSRFCFQVVRGGQNEGSCTFILSFCGVTAFSPVHSHCLIRGQNRYAKPMPEIPRKRYGQMSNARCSRCLEGLRLEFGSVPTAVTRIRAIVYANSRRRAKRQFAPITAAFPRQWRILGFSGWSRGAILGSSQFHNHLLW